MPLVKGFTDGERSLSCWEATALEREKVLHEIEPVFDKNSKILILGTMPSPKSRETGFYYGHPQNRFWRVMAELFCCEVPRTNEGRTAWLKAHNIALWDVLSSCEITGADDGSIKNPVPNDLNRVLAVADIKAVFTTGTKAFALYNRLCRKSTGIEAVPLPSTSPANCRFYTFDALAERYRVILGYL